MTAEQFYQAAQEAIEKENFVRAVELLTKAIELAPSNANYYSHRGVCYFHLKEMDKSLADMDKSVELDPDYGYRYASRAYIKAAKGDLQAAVDDYQKAVDLDPEDSVSYNNLGLVQEKMGYESKARSNFEKADKLAELLEGTGVDSSEKIEPRNIQQEINEEKKEQTFSKIFKSVFTDKQTFKEFIQFIKRGFKSK